MPPLLRTLRNFIISLQLTVVLLALSLILVFVATLDQTNLGVWGIQQKWFHSFIVYQEVNGLHLPVFPGGYLVGGLLFFNLLGAHLYRFQFTWKKSGIQLAHAGLIVLLCGELISGLLQRDNSMRLMEGETKSYAESFREYELAVIDPGHPDFDQVIAIPAALLEDKGTLAHPQLPFSLHVKEFYPNTMVAQRPDKTLFLQPQPLTYKSDEINTPGAILELTDPAGKTVSLLVSPYLETIPTYHDAKSRAWQLVLRLRRTYLPFSLTLLKANHDVYPGTSIPKNYSSRVRLKSSDGRENREVVIFMNNPLRHSGQTFYQYQMNQGGGGWSAFQVVSNPGWLLPYFACIMMGLGLCIQFGITLGQFVSKRTATP